MVRNYVTANYTETYDLNTLVDEMSVIGIHTPQAPQLKKMFKGYFTQYKKFKIVGCSIKMACAGTLPLDALSVGMDPGQIDPRDVMNPMLFKACTGENLNVILNQIYNYTLEQAGNTYGNGSIAQVVDTTTPAGQTPHTGGTKTLEAYYQMLADPTFRKAHPMQGIRIGNLRPFVHKVATTQPFKYTGLQAGTGVTKQYGFPAIQPGTAATSGDSDKGFGSNSTSISADVVTDVPQPSVFVSNGISPMPWLDTTVQCKSTAGNSANLVGNWMIQKVPRVYMGVLLLPPAKSTVQYFRAMVSWKIAFKEFRPAYEVGSVLMSDIDDVNNTTGFGGIDQEGSLYFNYYHDTETTSKMDKETSSFTTNSTEIDMINAEAR